MSNALLELGEFTRFAQEAINASDLTLQECWSEWRKRLAREQLLADVRQSDAEHDAGFSMPAAQALAEIRQELGLVQ